MIITGDHTKRKKRKRGNRRKGHRVKSHPIIRRRGFRLKKERKELRKRGTSGKKTAEKGGNNTFLRILVAHIPQEREEGRKLEKKKNDR